jgi:N-acetylneuraminic acid mutarotase
MVPMKTIGAGVAALALAGAACAGPAQAAPSFTVRWESRPKLPVPRQEVAYVASAGKLYLAGGLEAFGPHFLSARHERFDPATGSWQELRPLPAPANHLAGVAVGNRIYYVGGLRDYPMVPTGAVWIYDPATDRFTAGAPMPAGRARGAAGVALYKGRIYVAGGQRDQTATRQFDVYDPAADTWTALPDMPRAREHDAAVTVGDRLYVIAGRAGIPVPQTDAYDFATGRWTTGLAPIPTPRGGLAATRIGDEIVAIGGEPPAPALLPAFDAVESYNPKTDSWRALTPMPVGRHGIQAAVFDGDVWLAGGGDHAGLAPVADHTVMIPMFDRRPPGGGARHRHGSAFCARHARLASGW